MEQMRVNLTDLADPAERADALQSLKTIASSYSDWPRLSSEEKAQRQAEGKAAFEASGEGKKYADHLRWTQMPQDDRNDAITQLVRSCTTDTLDLSGKNAALGHPSGCRALCEAMLANTTITSLNVSGSSVGKAGMEELMPMLTGPRGDLLVEVDISANGIIGGGGQGLIDQVVGCGKGFEVVMEGTGQLLLRKAAGGTGPSHAE